MHSSWKLWPKPNKGSSVPCILPLELFRKFIWFGSATLSLLSPCLPSPELYIYTFDEKVIVSPAKKVKGNLPIGIFIAHIDYYWTLLKFGTIGTLRRIEDKFKVLHQWVLYSTSKCANPKGSIVLTLSPLRNQISNPFRVLSGYRVQTPVVQNNFNEIIATYLFLTNIEAHGGQPKWVHQAQHFNVQWWRSTD